MKDFIYCELLETSTAAERVAGVQTAATVYTLTARLGRR